jgi:DNA-binding NarL/FixJ family response regulator
MLRSGAERRVGSRGNRPEVHAVQEGYPIPRPLIRVVLSDPLRVFCQLAELTVEAQPDLEWLGSVQDNEAAVELVNHSRPDVAMITAGWERHDALETTRAIVRSVPSCKVVVLGEEEDLELITNCFGAGASGWLSRKCSTAQFLGAIYTAYNDGVVLSRHLLVPLLARIAEKHMEPQDMIYLDESPRHVPGVTLIRP